MSRPQSVWKMRRGELIDALKEMNVKFEREMTVPELRSVYMEARGPVGRQGLGLTKCTVEQLKEKCREEGLVIPEKAMQGLLLRLLRYSMETSGETEVTFGQYKHYIYREVPEEYLQWAVTEWTQSENCIPDLARLARWADRRDQAPPSRGYGARSSVDPELTAKNKPPPARLPARASTVAKVKNSPPARKTRGRALEESEDFSMVSSVDGPLSTEEEIHDLQERLKILQTVKKAEEAAKVAVPRGDDFEKQ